MYWPSMKNFVIYCLLCLCWSVQFCVSTPYGKEIAHSHKHSVSGCLHNNTMFADTSIVPSTEPCLVCKCSKRNLVCVRRVCKDQPYPPPRGCILVQKKSLCCPYLSCSKYHVNFYKNAERNREHINNNYQTTHEKTLEKRYRTDDDDAHPHNYDDSGCIESGSLYASGSAMHRSSGSLCTYCYCINGQQKCIKPKCMLKTSRCKPIFMNGSCCPVKYDCNNNSTALQTSALGTEIGEIDSNKNVQINVCFDGERSYQEGEMLPSNDQRPCEVCYCIKGARKCAVKKCAPVIHGCVPKVPAHGACCPTSYDCRRRSLRQSRQEDEDEVEEDTDTIDFFSLLFGSDDPKEEEVTKEVPSTTVAPTTLPPFKSLPPSTESSFFDLIRAGLEIIDANADKIDSQINKVVTTTPVALSSTERLTTTEESTRKTFETSTPSSEIKTPAASSISETKKLPSSTEMPKTSPLPTSSSTLSIKSSTELPTTASLLKVSTHRTTLKTTRAPAVKMSSTTLAKRPATTTRKATTSKAPPVTTKSTIQTASTTLPPPKATEATSVRTTIKKASTTQPPRTTTIKKVFVQTSTTKRPPPTKAPQKFIVPSLVETLQQQRLPSIVHYSADVLPGSKYSPANDAADNEADTLPNLEIIPFVAHDAIRTDKYEPYLSQPYEHALEKDYYATNEGGGIVSGYETEKPFRYNNKFIHHNYDDSLDYVYTNPHDRIDNGPYYFENQFESFSPPNEQDFLGGFSPKDTVYDEVSTGTKLPTLPALQSHHNGSHEKTLNTSAEHEHKSSEQTAATAAINQTLASDVGHQQQQTSTTTAASTAVPGFKKIASNFTSFIDDLLQVNALDDRKAPLVLSTPRSTPTAPITSTLKSTTSNAPIKSIINDDDFIRKHLKGTSSTSTVSKSSQKQPIRPQPVAPTQPPQKKQQSGLMEIFSKPTNPTMNGLLKLAGCNIYGQMYEVGHVIAELSNPCYECKCLPDIGVGCMPLC